MSKIRFYWARQKHPQTLQVGWTIRPFLYSRIGRDQIVDAAQRNSQIPKAYLQQTFDALITEVENFVMNGHSISLDGLGTIRSYFRGGGSATEENYSIEDCLEKVKFSFKPAPSLRRLMKSVSIRITDSSKPFNPPV